MGRSAGGLALANMDERTLEKIDAIRKGVELIADGVNSYDNSVRKELKYAFGTVHSTILNWIACAVLEAVAERCEFDNRFYPVIQGIVKVTLTNTIIKHIYHMLIISL